MEEKIINSMDETMLDPTQFITLMFERTDEDGILYTPAFEENYNDYRCRVDWNLEKYERLLEKFKKHYEAVEKIAPFEREIDDSYQKAEELLGSELAEFWNTYIRSFDIGDMDWEKIIDINDRLDTIELVRSIADNFAKGNEISDDERSLLSEYMDVTVDSEERDYRRKYINAIHTDSKKRLGKEFCSYDLIIRTMRLCRLINLGAPEIIVKNEARATALAMLLFEYGISKDAVDNTVRLQMEKMELMSDDELDELFRPKKANTRKSMAPLFVYSILKEKSSSKKHLRQQDILSELARYPYELTLERKALSRIIHNLIDAPQYAVFQDTTGVWIDQ